MKRFLTTMLLVALMSNLFAEINVKSFRKLENDLDARVNEPIKDQNGDVCAIIKVVTTQTGFSFDCGQIGVVKSVQKNSEIWVYVPYGAKRITITHPQLGMIRDYFFTVPIERATVYELVLITGRVETTVVDEMTSQWLVINPEPKDAMIYINDQFVKSGMYQAKVKPGTYTYRVEMALYHSDAGKIDITDAKKEVDVKLKPAFGFFSATSEPESGAKVIVDGKTQSKTTPFLSEALPSGIYTVQVVKEMYQPVTQKVTVIDGQTTPVNFVMSPNFAEITIIAPASAELYVNNQYKGTGTWHQRLNAGIYSFEARSDKHRPAKQDMTIVAGKSDTINLAPIPIYGSLDVMTDPAGANIVIDGKDHGTTPNTIYNLPIGDCNVQLSKSGYATVTKTVVITDGKSTELIETLSTGSTAVDSLSATSANGQTSSNERAVIISSNPSEAKLYIDGNMVGITPYNGVLNLGNHILRVEQGMEKVEKDVYISQTGGETNFKLTFAQQAFIESTNGLLDSNQSPSQSNQEPSLVRTVTISSDPTGANLYIDGNAVSQTPYNGTLGFGNHNLRIEQNGQTAEKTITISQTGGDTVFNLSLGQKTLNRSFGLSKTIRISSNPPHADLYIDGKVLEKTPTSVDLSYGTHSFIVTNGGKKNAQEIEINSETSPDLFFELYDCYTNKTIESNPSGATVMINGEVKGITPYNYTMLNKEDAVAISEKGYKTYKESISCNSKSLSVNLAPDKGKRTRLFLGANVSFPLISSSSSSSTSSYSSSSSSSSTVKDSLIYSFTIGIVKTIGIYAKYTTNFSKSKEDYNINDFPSNNYYTLTSSAPVYYTSRQAFIGGLMLNLKPVIFYAGAGYGYYNYYTKANMYKYSDDSFVKTINLGNKNSYSGLETDAGLIIFKGVGAFSVGVSSFGFKYYEVTGGIGFVF
jgi:hypothetical protein